jgi:hypothetical protein
VPGVPSPSHSQYHHADNWNNQRALLVSVPVEKLPLMRAGLIEPLGPKVVKRANAGGTWTSASAAPVIGSRIPHMGEYNGKPMFARMAVMGSGTDLTLRVFENGNDVTNLVGRLDFTTTTQKKRTPWLPLRSLGTANRTGYVEVQATGTGTVDVLELELGTYNLP